MWLLEKTVGHKHPCQSDMEALASVPPQICLCHVSCVILHLPGPRQQVASLSHIASWGSNQRNWHLVCTSWFIPTTKGNTVGLGWPTTANLYRKATPLPSQLLASETCWALMSSESQLPCELVPIFSKARNAAVGSLLTGWGVMASPALRMWAASPDIQP